TRRRGRPRGRPPPCPDRRPGRPLMDVVLVAPEIPQNTGSIGRLCVATDSALHLIDPLGFTIDDRHLRRAGLDYWPHVRWSRPASWEGFLAARRARRLPRLHPLHPPP